ncbi:MAG: hypothetical protein JNJ57_17450 [Saprospiraceae bacterium]|nr:hypothetical protein [Saprospiraceae bacterium]
MSKKILICCWLTLNALSGFAQDCTTCSCKIDAAINSKNKKDYKKALLQLTAAASTCGSNRSIEIQNQIRDIYDKIESLKSQAKKSAEIAKIELKKNVKITADLKKSETEARKNATDAWIAKNEADTKTKEVEKARKELELLLERLKLLQANKLQAEMKQKVFAQVEVFQIKGLNAAKEQNFDQAITLFQTAIHSIDTFSFQDSFLLTKREVLNNNIAEARQSQQTQLAFYAKIHLADSLTALGRMHYSKAFDALFEAHQMQYNPELALQKIKALDVQLQQHIKPGKEFIGPTYFQTMTKSFTANNMLQNNDVASSRMNACMILHPDRKLFAYEPEAMDFIKRYRYSFFRRIELYAGIKSNLPHTSPSRVIEVEQNQKKQIAYPPVFSQFTLGWLHRATNKIRLGVEFSTNDLSGISFNSKLLRFSNLPEFEYADQLNVPEKGFYEYPLPKQWDFTFLGAYKLKETTHRRWRTRQLTIEWMAGISLGYGNLGFANKYVQLFFDTGDAPNGLIQNIIETSGINNAAVELEQTSGPALYILDPSYTYSPVAPDNASYTNFLACKTVLLQLPFGSQNNRYNYTNGTTGFRFSFIPFPRLRAQIIGDLMYSFRLSKPTKAINFNLGEEMLKMVENTYQLSPDDAVQLSAYYLNNCNVDVTIRNSYAQFNTGLSFKLGLGFQF